MNAKEIKTENPDVTVRLTDERYTVILGEDITVPVFRVTCPDNVPGYGLAAMALGLERVGDRGIFDWRALAGVLVYDGAPLTCCDGQLLEASDRPATTPRPEAVQANES